MEAQKVGRRIQEARKRCGFTQEKFAEITDLSTKYISNVECGFKTPRLNTFVTIANALQCDANTLLSDVLDITIEQESSFISKKLLALPPEEQRWILHILDVLIDEAKRK